ncbi:MAG: NAD(P)/FAD-dependent oxidoreductase [Gammaproteobacteria bacterium]|nr:NAD(P)/FAD-dependent oxidoreductase [Gammaproteobacteria bacterium]
MNADVVILGGGAAGLMCAIEAARRDRKVVLIEKAKKVGKKILISGGGRCNFTNLYVESGAYLSPNSHFHKSALSRYTQWDFIALMEKHNLQWTEKTLGQLFCDQKAGAVVEMLLEECRQTGVTVLLDNIVESIEFQEKYTIITQSQTLSAKSLVIATGGPSIPKMGATDFGLQVAKQFGMKSNSFKPALVPFTFQQNDIDRYFKDLSGLSLDAIVTCNGVSFREGVLITHRGISGPAALQASSYWHKGDELVINLLPDVGAVEVLLEAQQTRGKTALKTVLSELLPRRFAERLANTLLTLELAELTLGEIKQSNLKQFGNMLNHWPLRPSGTEGMRTAEVCTGGVDVNGLSSKTMESTKQAGLYFIGETVDVTGWLGGYNFQWAWSSGWAAGQYV